MVGNFLTEDPVWAEDFAPNGTLLKLGDTITRRRYANTLETLAKEGIETFYTGAMGKSIFVEMSLQMDQGTNVLQPRTWSI